MSALDDAREELAESQAQLALLTEGARDVACTNFLAGAAGEVKETGAVFNGWLDLVRTAIAALDALVAAGYPFRTEREVPTEVLADIEANRESIEAFLSVFQQKTQASRIVITPGIPVQKGSVPQPD